MCDFILLVCFCEMTLFWICSVIFNYFFFIFCVLFVFYSFRVVDIFFNYFLSYFLLYYYLLLFNYLFTPFFFFFELFVDNFASILSFIFYPLRLEVARWSFLLKSMASLSCMVHSAVLFNILHLYQYL
jgi:hypothetical protein